MLSRVPNRSTVCKIVGECDHHMSSCCGSRQLPLPVGDKAHQLLNFYFPQRGFGMESAVKRSFQRQWFQKKWHGCTKMKTETLPSVPHVLLPIRTIIYILFVAWRKRLFQLDSQTGMMLFLSLPSTKAASVIKILC